MSNPQGDDKPASVELEWVKCSERMPKVGERVYFLTAGTTHWGLYNNDRFWDFERHQGYAVSVSHWMPNPLPAPPSEVTAEPEGQPTNAELIAIVRAAINTDRHKVRRRTAFDALAELEKRIGGG